MAAGDAALRVEVAYSPRAGEVEVVELTLPRDATLRAAVECSGLLERHVVPQPLRVGVWGRRRALDEAVRDGDRVEIYRPLVVDPKEARRRRAARATCSPKR